MLIHRMPDTLTWDDDAPAVWARVHQSFRDHVADAFGRTLARLHAVDPARAAVLSAELMELPQAAFERILLAPQTTSRLLWPVNYEIAETLSFLEEALAAELALLRGRAEASIWTALGDVRLDGDGAHPQPRIPGFPPLDLVSPHARELDLDGELMRLPEARPEMSEADRAVARDRCGRIAETLAEMGEEWALFLNSFTKVFVVQPDPDAPRSFSSGTSGQFVARSVLANAHLPGVSLEVLADGVIHETIHGLLYMQEQQQPWVLDPAIYGGERRVRSPWTGTILPIRPYMQAAFVWYGLLHFWARALEQGCFEPGAARERLVVAARGFQRGALVERLAPYADRIAPELTQAIDEMQARVVRTLDECVA